MRTICFICAAALIVLGGIGYFGWEAIGADKQSWTAGIPAIVGILMAVGGVIAIKNTRDGMHIAAGAAVLGALAGLGRLISSAIKGDLSGPAPILVGLMTVICVIFTVFAVRSFIAARRARG